MNERVGKVWKCLKNAMHSELFSPLAGQCRAWRVVVDRCTGVTEKKMMMLIMMRENNYILLPKSRFWLKDGKRLAREREREYVRTYNYTRYT